mmetsp:Transcript_5604/g.16349  ORF Transcript_5604/g.16349 Transcript_5604/m.16349 type:complete len:286 (-) Transcript_5604:217-1074(-)
MLQPQERARQCGLGGGVSARVSPRARRRAIDQRRASGRRGASGRGSCRRARGRGAHAAARIVAGLFGARRACRALQRRCGGPARLHRRERSCASPRPPDPGAARARPAPRVPGACAVLRLLGPELSSPSAARLAVALGRAAHRRQLPAATVLFPRAAVRAEPRGVGRGPWLGCGAARARSRATPGAGRERARRGASPGWVPSASSPGWVPSAALGHAARRCSGSGPRRRGRPAGCRRCGCARASRLRGPPRHAPTAVQGGPSKRPGPGAEAALGTGRKRPRRGAG